MEKWKTKHKKVIDDFLKNLNKKYNNYILKGGTALMTCYDLDRFSEDIDMDGSGSGIKEFVEDYCKTNGYNYRIAKDTETVNRFMIHYSNNNKPLKVEISFRNKNIYHDMVNVINGINVYNIDTICIQKTQAYSQRDKIRDLYDITFIANNYYNELSTSTKIALTEALNHKGIEQFDYLVKTQEDPLIDDNKLAEDFLKMYDNLGLLTTKEESEMIGNVYVSKHIRKGRPVKAYWRKRPKR